MTNNNFKNLRKMKVFNNIIILFFILIGISVSCSQPKNSQIKKENSFKTCTEEDVLNSISNIEKVKELDLRLKKYHYSRMCVLTRDSTQNPVRYFYIVQVGYDNGVSFVVDQNYYYYCDNKEIYYLETLTDSLIKVN